MSHTVQIAHRAVILLLAVASLINLATTPAGARSLVPAMLLTTATALLICWGGSLAGRLTAPGRPLRLRGLDGAIALSLLVLALVVRVHWLGFRPLAPNIDEGINGEIALRILDGTGPGVLLTQSVPGEEAATFHLHAWSFGYLGRTLTAFRLPAAVFGALFAPLLFLTARAFVGPTAAALAATVAAVDPTHVLFSRMANSIIYAPVFEIATLLFLWRSLEIRQRRDYVALGLTMGLGLHTYPLFRLVPILVAAVLAWHVARNWRLEGRACLNGPLTALAILLVFVVPIAWVSLEDGCYLVRLQQMTTFGRPVRAVLQHAMGLLPQTLAVASSSQPVLEGFSLMPNGVVPLVLVGAIALWASGRRPEEPGSPSGVERDRWLGRARVFLAASLVFGLLAPLLVTIEPSASRRFLLLLTPAYLLLAIGVERVHLMGPSVTARSRLALPVLFASFTWALAPAISSSLRHVLSPRDGYPQEMRFLRATGRLAKEVPVVISRSSVRRPFFLGQTGISPNIGFMLHGFGQTSVLGLNLYPTFPYVPQLDYVVAQGDWLPYLQSVFPRGSLVWWTDPEFPEYSLQTYRVTGPEAFKHQGLRLSTSATNAGSSAVFVTSLGTSNLVIPPNRSVVWSGALYLPCSGNWTFDLE
ncbi:MAG: glycosyltransferase family 39 protein, partial [Candidatus Riflebacteria bacterium]|nr:glycosyltransferase family 39 protein [Candidatus Riflebacteria bacterium]